MRSYTGSTTYSSDRGTGTVAAKTLATPDGPVIVVNAAAMGDAEDAAVERVLAHETGAGTSRAASTSHPSNGSGTSFAWRPWRA